MKHLAILTILLLMGVPNLNAQTNSEDVVFFVSGNFLAENYGEYNVVDVSVWGLLDNANKIRRSVKFRQVSKGGEKCGVGIIYSEIRNNTMTKRKAYFVPEKESKGSTWNSALNLVKNTDDIEELRTLLWALMHYSSDK